VKPQAHKENTTMKKLLLLATLLPVLAFAQVNQTVSPGTSWAINHAPAAATQATISRAAVAGQRHVATSLTICVDATAAQSSLVFNLRDGATGAGTVLWTARLSGAASTNACLSSGPIFIVGTANTAMTLESSAAPAATNFATVSLVGFELSGS
jgi:hypothetical protein